MSKSTAKIACLCLWIYILVKVICSKKVLDKGDIITIKYSYNGFYAELISSCNSHCTLCDFFEDRCAICVLKDCYNNDGIYQHILNDDINRIRNIIKLITKVVRW